MGILSNYFHNDGEKSNMDWVPDGTLLRAGHKLLRSWRAVRRSVFSCPRQAPMSVPSPLKLPPANLEWPPLSRFSSPSWGGSGRGQLWIAQGIPQVSKRLETANTQVDSNRGRKYFLTRAVAGQQSCFVRKLLPSSHVTVAVISSTEWRQK